MTKVQINNISAKKGIYNQNFIHGSLAAMLYARDKSQRISFFLPLGKITTAKLTTFILTTCLDPSFLNYQL